MPTIFNIFPERKWKSTTKLPSLVSNEYWQIFKHHISDFKNGK
jgi:hypothetical protein